jgi:hypothetical protein
MLKIKPQKLQKETHGTHQHISLSKTKNTHSLPFGKLYLPSIVGNTQNHL